MKILYIAWKDLLRSYRNLFLVGMAFVAPLLMGLLFSSAFGGSEEFSIAVINIGIVNLDQASSGFSAGEAVVDLLSDQDLADLLQPTIFESEKEAFDAIVDEKIQAAVIIPADLSLAVTEQEKTAQIRIIHDPTLSLSPQIIKSILDQMASGFSGAKITSIVIAQELTRQGKPVDSLLILSGVESYTKRIQGTSNTEKGYLVQHPEISQTEEKSLKQQIVSGVMASMMIFFTFFTGSYGAQTILEEQEKGTLARMITSPSRLSVILGGKIIGVIVIMLLQMTVLIISSSFLFKINWGDPLKITHAVLTTSAAASGLGLFLMSLVKDTRQAGIVLGGVLTVMGMAGGLFTGGIENLPPFLDKLKLFTPHGWSSRVWDLAQGNSGVAEMAPDMAVLFAIGLVLFMIGVLLFRRRYSS